MSRENDRVPEDAVAFETFVRVSGASLLRTAYLITGDRGHAEDVVQTALERVARRWSRIREAPEAYARRCVVNGATDHHRRRRARPQEVGGDRLPEARLQDGVGQLALRDALVAALRELPARQRTVVVCRYVLDLDERQTADLLDIGVGTVKASASRGLASLRRIAPSFDLGPTAAEPTFALTAHPAEEAAR